MLILNENPVGIQETGVRIIFAFPFEMVRL